MKYKLKKDINQYMRIGHTLYVTRSSVKSNREISKRFLEDAWYLFLDPIKRLRYFERVEEDKLGYCKVEDAWNNRYLNREDETYDELTYKVPDIPAKSFMRLDTAVNGKTFCAQVIGYQDYISPEQEWDSMEERIRGDFERIVKETKSRVVGLN